MGAQIIPFDFETNAVRVVMIEGAPWFVAVDVCRSLEIANSRDAISKLDDDEKGVATTDTLGGKQTTNIVSESGLYALIMMSRKPSAKRFRKWITAEVLPAIRRDGFYGIGSEDRAELAAKRAYYAALPEAHKTRADVKAGALQQIEDMIADGKLVGAALEAVAQTAGLSVRTLYAARRAAYMVPRSDWSAAMAPRWSGPRGMLAECHPEAMRLFLDLCQSGVRVADCYRRVCEVAAERGWAPVACQRTMYRVAQRCLPRAIPRPSKSKKEAA